MKPQAISTPQATLTAVDNTTLVAAPADGTIAHTAMLHARRFAVTHPGHTLAYPWLLLVSTTMAAVFCFMYITKPVIPPTPSIQPESPVIPPGRISEAVIPPDANPRPSDRLPGETGPPPAPKPASSLSPQPARPTPAFEETNLQLQHVLMAETPGGALSRIVVDVPVLYQSRTLGWTAGDVAESRVILKRLAVYQEKVRALRDEGATLLVAWNRLVEKSVPTPVLRADSPTLTTNQSAAVNTPKSTSLDTTEAIQIQATEK